MIYIQSDHKGETAHHFDAACAMYGAIETGQEYYLLTDLNISTGAYDQRIKRNLFVGSVEFMNEVFKRAGVSQQPRVPLNSNRPSDIITLADAKKRAESQNIFVKPVVTKLFTGLVLDGFRYSCLDKIPDNTLVYVYEPFNRKIESEWRCYIHNDTFVQACNYAPSSLIAPDAGYLQMIIDSNKGKFPVAYTIDIGVLSNGVNVVIEYNDMWAIGNYGLPNDLYLKMLKDRYFQIINNK